MKKIEPPYLAQRFLRWYCHPDLYLEIDGDIYELYLRRREEMSKIKADLLYWWNILTFCQPWAWKKNRWSNYNTIPMFKNYLLVSFRHLMRNKSYAGINILGLAGSTAISLLLIFYSIHIITYDQFHKDIDDIYFMYRDRPTEDGRLKVDDTWFPLLEAAIEEYPEVIGGTRVTDVFTLRIADGESQFEERTMMADSLFFDTFNFSIIEGNSKDIYKTTETVAISSSLAKKIFRGESPIGKPLYGVGDDEPNTVVAVFEDMPPNSSFQFDILLPLTYQQPFVRNTGWRGTFCYTFAKLRPNTNAEEFQPQLNGIMEKYVQESERGNILLLPFANYFDDQSKGQQKYGYILLFVAIGILLLACINFTNMATSQAIMRAKEAGVRRSLGASKGKLIGQHLIEALLITTLSMAFGVALSYYLQPYFNQLTGMELSMNLFQDWRVGTLIVSILLTTGLLSGSYPAYFVSRFQPQQVLKGGKVESGGMSIRNILVGLQFVVAIVFMSSLLITKSQIDFLKNYDYTFNKEQVVVLPASLRALGDEENGVARLVSFKNELRNISGVESVTASNAVPGRYAQSFYLFNALGKEEIPPLDWRAVQVEHNFFDAYDMQIVQGRSFQENSQTDIQNTIIINEAAKEILGWENPVGQYLGYPDEPEVRLEIIGVVEDFHYESLRTKILPVVHYFGNDSSRRHRYVSLKLNNQNSKESLSQIEKKWEEMGFLTDFNYFYPANYFQSLYQAEESLGDVLTYATSFALLIAFLGLFALTSFMVSIRTKEIAIKKVLGASIQSLLVGFNKRFVLIVLISFALAIPLSWWAMESWLENFAYRTQIEVHVFIFSGIAALLVSIISVSIQSLKASVTNPIKALRNE